MQETATVVDKRCKEVVGFCKPRARFAVPPFLRAVPTLVEEER
jgi:hypothetical protein